MIRICEDTRVARSIKLRLSFVKGLSLEMLSLLKDLGKWIKEADIKLNQ
jgi:hypothetical protein